MPDWAKGFNDGDEMKIENDWSEESFKKGDGDASEAWGNTENAYDLEEANAFIRMSDNGKID